MKIIAVANVEQQQEIMQKKMNAGCEMIFMESIDNIKSFNYDALFILSEPIHRNILKTITQKPVIINSVIEPLDDLPENFSRVNGWSSFLQRPVWEVATKNKMVSQVFEQLGWPVIFVSDEPGLVAARVISMIINEAYFALGEKVSTRQNIDLAMKLGTNYPYGPFEWAEKIGIKNIYRLLEKLTCLPDSQAVTGKRYLIAPELKRIFSMK